jgi:hypothetical protein
MVNKAEISSCLEDMKSAIVVKCGRESAASAIHIMFSSQSYLPAANNSSGIGKKDNLKKNGRVIGRSSGFIIFIMKIKDAHINLIVYKITEGIFKRSW